jgi:hypothetical protein
MLSRAEKREPWSSNHNKLAKRVSVLLFVADLNPPCPFLRLEREMRGICCLVEWACYFCSTSLNHTNFRYSICCLACCFSPSYRLLFHSLMVSSSYPIISSCYSFSLSTSSAMDETFLAFPTGNATDPDESYDRLRSIDRSIDCMQMPSSTLFRPVLHDA